MIKCLFTATNVPTYVAPTNSVKNNVAALTLTTVLCCCRLLHNARSAGSYDGNEHHLQRVLQCRESRFKTWFTKGVCFLQISLKT